MKKIILSLVFYYSLQFTYAQSGQLDPSFGNKGIVKTDMGAHFNYNSAARQVLSGPDESIYIILDGTSITKRFSNGAVNPGYGINGYAALLPLLDARGALQPDGKILLVGSKLNDSYYNEYFVVRININGRPDSTFGTNGWQKIPIEPRSVTTQKDGKIVVAGLSTDANNNVYFAVARFHPNGSSDLSFNGNGLSTTDFKYVIPGEGGSAPIEIHSAYASSLAIQADGKIVL